MLGFGVLTGAGIGFGYSSATPPALKWFPPAKTGMIAGIVVSGFGLAAVYAAPLATYLMNYGGLQWAMMFFGIAFAITVSLLSLWLVNPPTGYVPNASSDSNKLQAARQPSTSILGQDFTPREMLKTRSFYVLWLVYCIGAGAGLMVIGSVAGMAKQSMAELAFLAVVILAVGNAAGRIVAGSLSDRIGRTVTLALMLGFQSILMFIAIPIVGAEHPSGLLIVLIATGIGFNYGTNLALFPALSKDYWGLKHFGVNYGLLFTAWGVGGFVLGRISEMMKAGTGSYALSFGLAGTLLAVATLAMILKDLFRQMAESRQPAAVEPTLLEQSACS